MKGNRVEQHKIKKNNPCWKIIDELCFKSKNLYNYANYMVRQEFIKNNKWICYNELAKILKDSEPYQDLGSNVGQQTLKILDKNWKSFFKSIKNWSKNKNKYLGKPKLPKYKNKDGRFPLYIDNIKVHLNNNYIRFSWKPLKPLNNKFKTSIKDKLIQVRFIPRGSDYIMEVIYEIEVPEINKKVKNIIGIDLGIDNFATISNNIGSQPIIINGRNIKSMNQYYNKKKAEIQNDLELKHSKKWSNRLQRLTTKRNNKVDDYLHKSSRYVINYCLKNNINTIIIGQNKGWKQNVTLGKRNNQNFINIPYNLFISKLKYKCENYGINIFTTDEAYTSGTSFLDNEEPIKDNYNKSRRKTRGLFKSDVGVLINADVNAAYQIIKKVVPEAFVDGIEGVGLHPVRVNVI